MGATYEVPISHMLLVVAQLIKLALKLDCSSSDQSACLEEQKENLLASIVAASTNTSYSSFAGLCFSRPNVAREGWCTSDCSACLYTTICEDDDSKYDEFCNPHNNRLRSLQNPLDINIRVYQEFSTKNLTISLQANDEQKNIADDSSAYQTALTIAINENPNLNATAVVSEIGQPVRDIRLVVVTQSTTPAPSTTPEDDGSSNSGAIVGGVMGGLLGVALLVGIGYYFWKQRQEAA